MKTKQMKPNSSVILKEKCLNRLAFQEEQDRQVWKTGPLKSPACEAAAFPVPSGRSLSSEGRTAQLGQKGRPEEGSSAGRAVSGRPGMKSRRVAQFFDNPPLDTERTRDSHKEKAAVPRGRGDGSNQGPRIQKRTLGPQSAFSNHFQKMVVNCFLAIRNLWINEFYSLKFEDLKKTDFGKLQIDLRVQSDLK